MFKPDLKKVLGGFNKMVTQLQQIQDDNRLQADTKRTLAAALHTEAAELEADADYAASVCANIQSILQVK